MKRGIFVTGTDTGIGKTVASACLVSAFRSFGVRTYYYKPVQTGLEDDTSTVAQLCRIPADDVHPPSYAFEFPAAPWRAATAAGQSIDLENLCQDWQRKSGALWVIEGAGGVLVPLTSDSCVCDLIARLQVPALVVASTRLGTINHTLLTLEALGRREIPVHGIVLIGPKDPGLVEVLSAFADIPVVAEIPWTEPLSPEAVDRISQESFTPRILERLTVQRGVA